MTSGDDVFAWLEECAVIWDLLHLLHLGTIVNSTILWDKCIKIIILRLILVYLIPSPIFRRRLRAFGREASLPAEAATASPTT